MKKVISLFLALLMILSIGTVGVSAFDFYDPPICIATYPYHVRKGDVVYYPYEFKNRGKDFYKLCEDEGIENGEVKLRFRYSYDAESLELVDVYPDKDLYEAGGTAKIIERYTDEESYNFQDFYVVEVTFDLTSYFPDGEYLFNTCFNVLQENFYYQGLAHHLIRDKNYYEAGENYEEYKKILCEVTDENGQVHDMSKYFTWSAIIIDDGFNSYDDLLIKNYEPFIPPVEEGKITADTKFEYGETYYINNYEDFTMFVRLVNEGQTGAGSTFELTSDIIINHGTFSLDENNEPLYVGYPITKNTKLIECDSASMFGGTFDGKNNSIIGFYSKASGVFGMLCGTVKNLCINNSLFDLRGSSAESAGALCAEAYDATVTNVVFKGIIINDGANTGGIVGKTETSSFEKCRNYGTVIGADYCGGIIGKQLLTKSITDCLNKGNIISSGSYVGGISSVIKDDTSVDGCANAGTIVAQGDYVGGIAGTLELDEVQMKNCYHSGSVSGNDYVGGIAGSFHSLGENFEGVCEIIDDYEKRIQLLEEALRGYRDDDSYHTCSDSSSTYVYNTEQMLEDELRILRQDYNECLRIIEAANPRNLLYTYSAGDVISSGEYVGSLFGEMTGCVWRCDFVVVNYEKDLPLSGKDYIESIARETWGNASAMARSYFKTKIYEGDTATLQDAEFAVEMSAEREFAVDTNNENNGYVMLKALVSDENEPGYTDITQTVTDLTIGTTDKITFASDETKTYKFTPETDGDYKVNVSGVDKALVRINAYKNGDLVKEGSVATTDEYPAYEAFLKPVSKFELEFEDLVAGDEIVIEIMESVNLTIAEEPILKSYAQYFMPSSITITVENTTPVEDQPLFEFGVTSQHIRNRFDMLYYPASFGFSMYDDADIRYSDICADVADLAFGCDTEVVMKYIYDATTLDFVSVYEDFWEGSVEVLEHGSTGMTGDEGQEYNYIIIKAKFVAVGYANDTAPYYLKFAVVEDNFINSDGTVRKVIDNVPYSEDQLCVWNAWDAKGNSFDFSDKIKLKSSDYETDGYTYDNLLLEDDLIDTDIAMPTVTFTPEHARKDDLAYYPCMYDSNVDYEEWVRSATGFTESTTKVQIKVDYDSSTLELIDALPSKELYDLGGTVTIIETGDLYPNDPDYGNLKYAIVQLDFDALDFNEGCLFSLKFKVLQENFLDEEGYPIDLVNSFVADWVVTSNAGKSHDLRYYVSSSYAGFASYSNYEELILADYEPFDPTLLSDVTEVTYVQQEDTHKTFTVTANGRKQMIQFIEPDGGTRTYDRYNKNVTITSYNADGEVVSAMSRDLAYEVWEIYSNMSVGVEIKVRGKENGVWDKVKYTFIIEAYNPIVSMELSATSGKKGAVPATVVADEKTEKVMFKMPNGTSVTVSNFTTDENGNRVFTGKAWMNEDGINEIQVLIRRKNIWQPVGTLEYTVE